MRRLRQTQRTSTAASETQQEPQPALTLQLRTEQQTPPTSWKLAEFTFLPSVNMLNRQAKCVYFLTHCPLLPADVGTWQSPFPSESWYPATDSTHYSDPPFQLGVASVEPLNWQLFPGFGLADNCNVLQFQPNCLLKTFSTANEKNRDVLFKRIHFCVKIAFWLKSLSLSLFIHVTVY